MELTCDDCVQAYQNDHTITYCKRTGLMIISKSISFISVMDDLLKSHTHHSRMHSRNWCWYMDKSDKCGQWLFDMTAENSVQYRMLML